MRAVHHLRSIVAAALCALMAAAGLVATGGAATAATASDFEPGYIISDENFFAGGTMSASAVQAFLNAKVTTCAAGYTCLKDYRQDTPTLAADAYCDAYSGKAGETAASIIARVGKACDISQRVLLVLIQKETSLITHTWPSQWRFDRATGFACPDTAPCDTTYGSYFYQVYYAARQYQRYAAHPSYYGYRAGRTSSILYNPKSSCGSAPVYVANQATAGLYIYTPYQPNAAALKNLYGTGDSCSSYGNRNFWRLYTDWFGDPRGGSIVRAGSSGPAYLLASGVKHEFASSPSWSDFSPLGPIVSVTQSYLDSKTAGKKTTYMVKDVSTNEYFFVDRGYKHALDQCSGGQGHDFLYSCGAAPAMTTAQLLQVPSRENVSNLVKVRGEGTTFLVEDGRRHAFTSTAALAAAGYDVPSTTVTLSLPVIERIPFGDPAVGLGEAVTDGEWYAVGTGEGLLRVSASLWAEAELDEFFTVTELESAAMPSEETPRLRGLLRTADDPTVYALRFGGRTPLTEDMTPAEGATQVPQAFIDLFPVVGGEISGPAFVRDHTSALFLVEDGTRRRTRNNAERAFIATAMEIPEKTRTLPTDVVANLPGAGRIIAPGIVATAGKGAPLWYIDGPRTRRQVSAALARELAPGWTSVVPDYWLSEQYTAAEDASLGMWCGDVRHLLLGGERRAITEAATAGWEGALPFLEYSAWNCNVEPLSEATVGQLLTDGQGRYYVIEGGRRYIGDPSLVAGAIKRFGPAVEVSKDVLREIRIGATYTG